MALTKPALATVEAGRPVTAQGWNAIVNGLAALYDAVLAMGSGVVKVDVVAGGAPVLGAQVVGVPQGDGGHPVDAIPPYAAVTSYTLGGTTAGAWKIHVRAAGFDDVVRDVTLPVTDPISIELTSNQIPTPDLFAQPMQQALTVLAGVNLSTDLVLDIMGHEVPRVNLPPQYQNAPVLFQTPLAGELIDPVGGKVRFVVAVALQQEPVVTMPSLVGLTQDEAVKVLTNLGLTVGKITIRDAS